MRRLTAVMASLLVLTFSFSGWSNVCPAMSLKSSSQASAHMMAGMSHSDAGLPSQSHGTSGNRTGSDHCQHMSCSTSTLSPVVERGVRVAIHGARIVSMNEALPLSQSPDLEPPPPKA